MVTYKWHLVVMVPQIWTRLLLIDRHMEISHLQKQLAEEEQLIGRIRREASADLLNTLPGFNHFRDRLAMEHRRASHMGLTFSLL